MCIVPNFKKVVDKPVLTWYNIYVRKTRGATPKGE
nr:MAG TPA: hypothetical protein [Caudoviricetes sp.]